MKFKLLMKMEKNIPAERKVVVTTDFVLCIIAPPLSNN